MKYARLSGEVKSPLRYPGGKSRAIPQIIPLIPPFKEYREPFIGGGSVFVAVKQRAASDATFKINDLNQDLYCLWKVLRDEPERLIDAIKETKARYVEGAELNRDMRDWQCNDDFERAVRFFIINRTSFSGLSDSGGFSQQAFRSRFTDSSIARLVKMKPIMKDVIITNDDYHVLLEDEGDDVFIFLDPPYFKAMKKRLYGKDGDLHVGFDHERFARDMQACHHKWLITYDDAPEIRDLFGFATIYDWELQYGMNNFMQGSAAAGKELFIMNYTPSTKPETPATEQKTKGNFTSLDAFLKKVNE
ncbi:MAG TPA: DNA adenine methylase [Candidatus Lokiarchaeia archaeon]|nr:DNA adenine methylase [Candidatus Lokiarchaeia archaeon]